MSTLQYNQGNEHLQVGRFISTHICSSYFVGIETSSLSKLQHLHKAAMLSFSEVSILNSVFESICLQKRFQSFRVNASRNRKLECAFFHVAK